MPMTLEFSGAVVLVSHDRYLLDRVSTMVIGLDAGGAGVFADYSQWEAARSEPPEEKSDAKERRVPAPAEGPRKKLSYIEQREWDGMERAILDAESTADACYQAVEDPGIAADPAALQARYAALEAARAEVARLYARWAELEAKQA